MISVWGGCISVQEDLNESFLQQNARLFIKDREDNLSPEFPCTIVRQGENKLCLQLDRAKSTQFGIMLTKGLFSPT